MELRDYLHFRRLTVKEFADTCGLSRGYMSLLVGGHRPAGVRAMQAIEEATNGQVNRYDLLKDYQESFDDL